MATSKISSTTMKQFLKQVVATVPVYKEVGEDCMEAMRHIERKLSYDINMILPSAGIKVTTSPLLEKFGSGVLAVHVGRHLDRIEWLRYADRHYDLTVKLGEERLPPTAAGELLASKDYSHVTREAVLEYLARFKGPFEQRKPSLVEYIDTLPRSDHLLPIPDPVHEMPRIAICYGVALRRFDPPFVELDVHSGANFHPRTFVEDFGASLGTVAHMTRLHRRSIGPFRDEDAIPSYAVSWKRFQEANVLYRTACKEYSRQLRPAIREQEQFVKVTAIYR